MAFQVTPSYLQRLAQVESGGDPNARNPNSSAKGLYQFIDSTAKQYGLADPFNPVEAEKAAIRLTQDNYGVLKNGLGREPTEGELYLAHQQGATGALRLLANQSAPVQSAITPQAAALNAGTPEMTAGDFAGQWTSKFDNQSDSTQTSQNYAMQGLTPEEEAELIALEAEIGEQQALTADEEAELAALEAELAPAPVAQSEAGLLGGITDPKQLMRQAGLAARYGAEGLAGLADLPNMAINAAIDPINAATGSDIQKLGYPSQYVSSGLDAMGLPKPENATERVVGDASRAVSGLGGAIGGATALAKNAPNLSRLSEMAKSISGGAQQQAQAALGSSLAAGSTREAGGGELAQLAAGLAGGIGAGAIGAKPTAKRLNSEDIRKQASNAYQKADSTGGMLTDTFTNKFLDEADKVTPQTMAGKIVAGDDAVTKIVTRIKDLKDKPLSLAEAQEIDEYLGDAIDGMTELGRVNKQGKKLLDVQSSFRNLIENADPSDIVGGKEGFDALKEGRKLWSKSVKLRDIERIIDRAALMDNPATGIKSGFRTLLNNPNRVKGFSKEEQEAIRKAAETGLVGDTLRAFGSRLIPIVTTASGAGGVGGAAAAMAGSTATRNAATALQLKRANALADLVAGNKPAARNMTPAATGALQGLLQTDE